MSIAIRRNVRRAGAALMAAVVAAALCLNAAMPAHADDKQKELENKKIPTQQIAGSTGNWEKNQANVIVRQWMKEYPNQIEVIISNNDDMALGAWEALEEKGCTEVQVVGIDGIEEVRELVDEDKILGSVLCDTKLHAKALMQFIDVLAFHNGSVEKLNLENERYYMIPLTKVEK